jgi:hypothetical protein
MAWVLKSHVGAQSGTSQNVTTGAINTTGADLLVVVQAYYGPAGASVISDSAGNTWTDLTVYASAHRSVKIGYVQAPTTSASHTFTSTQNNSNYPTLCVSAWSGSVSTPKEDDQGATTAGATSLATGNATPTTTDLFITGCSQGGTTGTLTLSAGFTVTDAFTGVANAVEGGMGYATGSSAVQATWNFDSNEAAVCIAAFKGAGGGAAFLAGVPVIVPQAVKRATGW